MRRLYRKAAIATGLAAVLGLPQVGLADTLVLTDGTTFHGKILVETVSAFRWQVNCTGRIVFIRKEFIAKIQRDNRCG
jgi:hypothetical protein